VPKDIDVTIDPDGTVSLDALGFKGKECEDITKKIAKDLGQKISGTKKPEYWQPNPKRRINQKQKQNY